MTSPMIMSKIPTSMNEFQNAKHEDIVRLMSYMCGPNFYDYNVLLENNKWGHLAESEVLSILSKFRNGGHLELLDFRSRDGVNPPEHFMRVKTNKKWYIRTGETFALQGQTDTAKQMVTTIIYSRNMIPFIKEVIMCLTLMGVGISYNKRINRKTLNGYYQNHVESKIIEELDLHAIKNYMPILPLNEGIIETVNPKQPIISVDNVKTVAYTNQQHKKKNLKDSALKQTILLLTQQTIKDQETIDKLLSKIQNVAKELSSPLSV